MQEKLKPLDREELAQTILRTWNNMHPLANFHVQLASVICNNFGQQPNDEILDALKDLYLCGTNKKPLNDVFDNARIILKKYGKII